MGAGSSVAVGVAGDWHGNTRWALHALSELHGAGVHNVWHLGDFGLWPGGGDYLDAVDDACARLEMKILVTPGNHEDYSQLPGEPGVTAWVRDRIAFLPRGHRFTINGWQVASFGGAPSIDFEHRVEGVSWWRAELPSEEEVDAAIADGPCDILLLHDSPDAPYATDAVSRILRSNAGWSIRALAYASVGRERVSRLRAKLQPRMTLHGHFHVADNIRHGDGSWTVSLSADGMDGNLGILTLPPRRASTDGDNTRQEPAFAFLAEPEVRRDARR